MKKMLVLAAALLIGLGIANLSFAATASDSDTVIIRVTVSNGTTGITRMSSAVSELQGVIAPLSNTIVGGWNGRIVFLNDGDRTANWMVQITNFIGGPTPWVLVDHLTGGTPGTPMTIDNTARLAAVFTDQNYMPVIANFAQNDNLSAGNDRWCDQNAIAIDSEMTAGVKGNGVSVGGWRHLMWSFDAPTATSSLGYQMDATLTVNAFGI